MLPLSRRIKKTEFDLIKSAPKKIFSSSNFVLKLFFSGLDVSRFAVVVPSSVFKKAVQRNEVKRRTRGVVSACLGEFKEGFTVLIYAKKGSIKLSFQELRKELLNLFKKAKILKND